MISRRAIVAGALMFTAPRVAVAQSARKPPRVAVLNASSASESPAVQREPFERGLRELGWTPGVDVVIDYRYAEGDVARLSELAVDVVARGADIIVARGNPAIRATRQTTSKVPIVMSSADDPVADGFVQTLARPGGNITGIANIVSGLDGKRLELLKETISGLTRVAVLTNPKMRPGRDSEVIAALREAGRTLGLDVQIFPVTRLDELAGIFAKMAKARIGAVQLRADTQVLEPNRPQVVALIAKHRLPAIYPWHFYTEIGGLMSYSTSIPAFHHRSATYVDRILKGARPAELPVEQPTKFEFVVNLKTAKEQGLTIPQPVLLRADRLIE